MWKSTKGLCGSWTEELTKDFVDMEFDLGTVDIVQGTLWMQPFLEGLSDPIM